MLGAQGLDVKARSKPAMVKILTAVIVDSRRVANTLEELGIPDIMDGKERAAAMVATFDHIVDDYVVWRAEMGAKDGRIWSVVRMQRRFRAVEALLVIGQEFERLPHTRERQEAMMGSPVCRDIFGSVRVD